jgi:hypothetical protein
MCSTSIARTSVNRTQHAVLRNAQGNLQALLSLLVTDLLELVDVGLALLVLVHGSKLTELASELLLVGVSVGDMCSIILLDECGEVAPTSGDRKHLTRTSSSRRKSWCLAGDLVARKRLTSRPLTGCSRRDAGALDWWW